MGLCEERINLVVCEFYKKKEGGKKKHKLEAWTHNFFNGQGANFAW